MSGVTKITELRVRGKSALSDLIVRGENNNRGVVTIARAHEGSVLIHRDELADLAKALAEAAKHIGAPI